MYVRSLNSWYHGSASAENSWLNFSQFPVHTPPIPSCPGRWALGPCLLTIQIQGGFILQSHRQSRNRISAFLSSNLLQPLPHRDVSDGFSLGSRPHPHSLIIAYSSSSAPPELARAAIPLSGSPASSQCQDLHSHPHAKGLVNRFSHPWVFLSIQ